MKRALFALVLLLAFSDPARAELPPGAEHPVTLREPTALEQSTAFGILSRHYRYNDDVYGFLRDYTLKAGPMGAVGLRVYPGAFVHRRGIASVFGLDLRFERSFGLQSERQNGVRFPTIHRVLELNALARITSAGHGVTFLLGYGHHAFELGRTEPSAPDLDNVPDVPSAGYGYLRLGAEGRVALHDRVALDLSASYLVLTRLGGIEDDVWFPRARGGGMTLGVGAGFLVTRCLELRASLTYRRYFLDMRVEPTDDNIAGGALDQYTMTELALVYRY